jgi:hypothetical protein
MTEDPAGVPVRMTSPRLEGEVLREVGDELREREDEPCGRVVLRSSPFTQVRTRSAPGRPCAHR